MPPTYIGGLLAGFLFLDHRYDLFVRKSRLHLSVLLLGGPYTNLEEAWRTGHYQTNRLKI